MKETRHINIVINNIKTERGGQLIVFIFGEAGFPKEHKLALMKYTTTVSQSHMEIPIRVPTGMEFALKVLHDENGDGKVTKNWTGIIPYDGIGFSNGARIRFAPPTFDQARISYQEDLAPIISIQYF